MTTRPTWVQDILDKELARFENAPEPEPEPCNDAVRLAKKRATDAKALAGHVSPRVLKALVEGELEETRALMACRRWFGSPAAILVLSGGVGVGKTVAAVSTLYEPGATVARKHFSTGINGVTALLPELRILRASELAQTIDPWREDAEAGIKKEPPIWPRLVLDDLGTEFADNKRFRAALEKTVDLRMNRRQTRTVITTNLPREDIRPLYGDRVADRLNDCGVFVAIAGESRRRKGHL